MTTATDKAIEYVNSAKAILSAMESPFPEGADAELMESAELYSYESEQAPLGVLVGLSKYDFTLSPAQDLTADELAERLSRVPSDDIKNRDAQTFNAEVEARAKARLEADYLSKGHRPVRPERLLGHIVNEERAKALDEVTQGVFVLTNSDVKMPHELPTYLEVLRSRFVQAAQDFERSVFGEQKLLGKKGIESFKDAKHEAIEPTK